MDPTCPDGPDPGFGLLPGFVWTDEARFGAELRETRVPAPITQLVYASTPTHAVSQELLDRIASAAAPRNASVGITGLLLATPGRFLQLIEGPAASIDELYARIGRDPRHTGLRVLHRGVARARLAPSWSMAPLLAAPQSPANPRQVRPLAETALATPGLEAAEFGDLLRVLESLARRPRAA